MSFSYERSLMFHIILGDKIWCLYKKGHGTMINLFFLKYVWWKKGFVEHGVLQPCHHLIYLHNISKVLPLTSAKTWQRLSKELLLCVSASREYNFRTTSKSNKPKTTSLNEKRKQINSFHLELRTNIISRHFSYTSKRKST